MVSQDKRKPKWKQSIQPHFHLLPKWRKKEEKKENKKKKIKNRRLVVRILEYNSLLERSLQDLQFKRYTEGCRRILKKWSSDWVAEVRWVYINTTYICVICSYVPKVIHYHVVVIVWLYIYMTEVHWHKYNVMIYQHTCIWEMCIDLCYSEIMQEHHSICI